MKTVCINLPRESADEADALHAITYNMFKGSRFAECLDVLHERVREPFALELYMHRQILWYCCTGPDQIVDMLSDVTYSMISAADIVEIPDFMDNIDEDDLALSTELKPIRPEVVPLRNYGHIQFDTMTPVLNTFSTIPYNYKIFAQYVCCPEPDVAKLHFKVRMQELAHLVQVKLRPYLWFKNGYTELWKKEGVPRIHKKLYHINWRVGVAYPHGMSYIEQNPDIESDLKTEVKLAFDTAVSGVQLLNFGRFE